MKVTTKLVGAQSLSRKFGRMGEIARGDALETALVAGGLVIATRWKQLAPVKTGSYRRSIHVGGHTDQTSDFEGDDLGQNKSANDGAKIIVGTAITDPAYPVDLENGTVRMAARPSAQPAFDEKKDEAVREVKRALKVVVRASAP